MDILMTTYFNQYSEENSKLYKYGIIVWLEPNANDTKGEAFINQIKDKVQQVEVFDDADICMNFILSSQCLQVFFVISGIYAKTLVPLIHDIQSINSIFIYCKNCPIYRIHDSERYSKIIGIFDDQNFLLSIIFEKLQKYQNCNWENPKNVFQSSPLLLLNKVVSEWFEENSQIPSETTQNILVLYNSKINTAFRFENLIRKLSRLPYIHLEVEYDSNNAYDKMAPQQFSYWRVVVDGALAKEFIVQRKKQMISRCFCVIVIIYAPTDDNDLSWAMHNPVDVWGNVTSDDERILKFCSGDPCTRIHNVYRYELSKINKSDALHYLEESLKCKLPFGIITKTSEDFDTKRLDGSKLTLREHRFTDTLIPQFVTNFRKDNLAPLMANLISVNNTWSDVVIARCLRGICCHTILNNRPMEHLRNRLIKSLIPAGEMIPGETESLYFLRAFTEETFLYKDVNFALATNDQPFLRCFRDYIGKCNRVFELKLIPCYVGTLYRGVQMTNDDLQQYQVGKGIQFMSFISTSKSLEFVRFLGTNVIFIIHTLSTEQLKLIGRFTNVDLHLSNISVMPSEEEVLYAPFSSFIIQSIHVSENEKVTFITLKETDLSAASHTTLEIMQQMADKGHYTDIAMTIPHLKFDELISLLPQMKSESVFLTFEVNPDK